MSGANSLRSNIHALCANGAIATVKLFAAIITGSSAMLAEAVHSVADCTNQLLLLLGIRQSKRPPTPTCRWATARRRNSGYLAMHFRCAPEAGSIPPTQVRTNDLNPIRYPFVALGTLGFGLAAEWICLRACLTEVDKVGERRSLLVRFNQSRESELIVIFAEHITAIAGLLIAFAAISVTVYTDNPIFMIGVLLVVIAGIIAREMRDPLIGPGDEPGVLNRMTAFRSQYAQVDKTAERVDPADGGGPPGGRQDEDGVRHRLDSAGQPDRIGLSSAVSASELAVLQAR